MSIFEQKTEWIDRVIDSSVSAGAQTQSKLTGKIGAQLADFFDHPGLQTTLLIRDREQTLQMAGITHTQLQSWKGIGVVLGSVLGLIIALATSTSVVSWTIIFVPLLGLAGFIGPEIIVKDLQSQQKTQIQYDFPRFLDILHLYTASAAYQSMPAAMYLVATHLEGSLARQLRGMLRIYRFVDLHVFLDEFEKQFPIPLAQDLCATIRVADQYGGSISQKVAILSDEAHKQQLRSARKAGQRASAALMIPLMVFHFPVAVIIFLAPTALALREMFGW